MGRPARTISQQARMQQKEHGESTCREPVLADIIDMGHLARYTMGDPGLEQELLRMFAAQLEDLCTNLRASDAPRHFRLIAHTLKGASRAVGAVGLAHLAAALEEVGPGNEAKDLLDELDRQAARFHSAFASWEKLRNTRD